MPNTYQARTVNGEKAAPTKKFFFFVERPTRETLRLDFALQFGRWASG
jgi:hypothetical protein